ncbi:hypothetical protein EJB05_49751, partial [Eragrostis curvula]
MQHGYRILLTSSLIQLIPTVLDELPEFICSLDFSTQYSTQDENSRELRMTSCRIIRPTRPNKGIPKRTEPSYSQG